MLTLMARNWWALALRGVFAILFGVLAVIWPELTLTTLILLFGAYALVDGIFSVILGITSIGKERWWVELLEGIAGIIIGIVTFVWPDLTALTLLYFIAAWAFITGVMEIAAAIQLRRLITGEWAMILSGALSILFAIILVLFPGEGALALTWLIGVYAIIFGVVLIVLAFRLRGMRRELDTTTSSRGFTI